MFPSHKYDVYALRCLFLTKQNVALEECVCIDPCVHGQCACIKYSATGTRTRVARVRAEYPNQLDYSGDIKGGP